MLLQACRRIATRCAFFAQRRYRIIHHHHPCLALREHRAPYRLHALTNWRKAAALHSCSVSGSFYFYLTTIVPAKGSYSATRNRTIDRMQIHDLYAFKYAYCEHIFLSMHFFFLRDKKIIVQFTITVLLRRKMKS